MNLLINTRFFLLLTIALFAGFLLFPKNVALGITENQKLLSAESSSVQKSCNKYLNESGSKLKQCIREARNEPAKIKEGGDGKIVVDLRPQPNIRVGIASAKKGIKIAGSSGNLIIKDKSNKVLKEISKDKQVEISMSGSNYILKGSGANLKLSSFPRFSAKGGILDMVSPKEFYHHFRGTIEVRKGGDGKLWVINELPLENYLAGIGELGNSGPEEYIKALGIAARTYAYYWESEGGRHPGKNVDLYDTESDQLYYGYDYEKKIPRANKIFSKVKGQIITYKGDPIVAVYSSSSGGKTKKGPYPYLKSVSDPYGGKTRLGHGMGLSAKGAVGYAEHGKSYKWILSHYYSGTGLKRVY